MVPTQKSVNKRGDVDLNIGIAVKKQKTNLSILIGEMRNQDAGRMIRNSSKWGLSEPEMRAAVKAMQNKPKYVKVGLVANDYVRESEMKGSGMNRAGVQETGRLCILRLRVDWLGMGCPGALQRTVVVASCCFM